MAAKVIMLIVSSKYERMLELSLSIRDILFKESNT